MIIALKAFALAVLWVALIIGISLINIAGKCSREEEETNLEWEMKKHGK